MKKFTKANINLSKNTFLLTIFQIKCVISVVSSNKHIKTFGIVFNSPYALLSLTVFSADQNYSNISHLISQLFFTALNNNNM